MDEDDFTKQSYAYRRSQTIQAREQPTECRKAEGKIEANRCLAQDPLQFAPGTMCAVHTATVTCSVIAAFHISTSEGPVVGDTPVPWVH